jgi:hypothetical protein
MTPARTRAIASGAALIYPFLFGLVMMRGLGKSIFFDTSTLEVYVLITGLLISIVDFQNNPSARKGGAASFAVVLLKTVTLTGFFEVCALFAGFALAMLPRLI